MKSEIVENQIPAVPAELTARVLVVDDDAENRIVLKAILEGDGFTVLMANNGVEAIAIFESQQPDIILMDLIMPVMDGYEATRRIKEMSEDRFVPVIFLTALTDEQALVKCIEAGGDDFFTKPYKHAVLLVKIRSFNKLSALNRDILQKNEALTYFNQRLVREREVAKEIFDDMIDQDFSCNGCVKYLLSPAAFFNGDIILVAKRPSGGLHVLLGDFTGQGLSAAIGSMPVSSIFKTMTDKGYSISEVVEEINRKLLALVPKDMFLAACVIEIDSRYEVANVWNGGMPDAYVYGEGEGITKLPSRHLPLGVIQDGQFDSGIEVIELRNNARIILYSDGVTEASNRAGDMFGQKRLESILNTPGDPDEVFDNILREIDDFRHGDMQSDDIAMVEISSKSCLPESQYKLEEVSRYDLSKSYSLNWQVRLVLKSEALKNVDPIPPLIHLLTELQKSSERRGEIHTILMELYENALEHGLLGLHSDLKNEPDGFVEYYNIREQRLKELKEGEIVIDLKHHSADGGERLVMRIEDTSNGFDVGKMFPGLVTNEAFNGRGIALVKGLCSRLKYHDNGNCVEAVYEWK